MSETWWKIDTFLVGVYGGMFLMFCLPKQCVETTLNASLIVLFAWWLVSFFYWLGKRPAKNAS